MKIFHNDDDENAVPTSTRRHRRQHSSWQVLADFMTLMFQSMIVLLFCLLAVSQIAAKKSDGDTHPPAEYQFTLTWANDRNVDLDLWVRDPDNDVIFYGSREAKNISLDRDSRGQITNRTYLKDGTAVDSPNREVISVRAIIPGDYLIAVSYYDGSDAATGHAYGKDDPAAAIDAEVIVEKVNPKLATKAGAKVHLTQIKEAVNALAIHIAADGDVTVLPIPADNLVYEHGGGAQ